MAVSKDLFELVKTINNSEKKFFKNDTFKTRSSSHYLKMFNFIEKQDEYDEELLLKKMQKVKGFSNLSASKNYLYKLIMSSLVKYNRKTNISLKISNILNEVQILFEKGLNKKCLFKLKKGIELCEKFELNGLKIQFIQYQLALQQTTVKRKELNFDFLDKTIKHHLSHIEYQKSAYIIQSLLNELGFVPENSKKPFQKIKDYIENNELFSNEKFALTRNSKCTFYNFNAMLAHFNGDMNKCHLFTKKHIEIYNKNIEIESRSPKTIISAYCNYLQVCLFIKKYDEFEQNIKILKKFKIQYNTFNTLKMRAKTFECYASIELSYYLDILNIDKCIELIKEYEIEYKKLSKFLANSYKYYFYFEIANVYFVKNDTLKTIDYLNIILASEKEEINLSLLISTYMLIIIAYFEEEMFELMQSNIRALKRILVKSDNKGKEEDLIFKFMNILLKTPKSEYNSVFSNFNQKIKEIEKKGGKFLMYSFDFKKWIESKAKNISLFQFLQNDKSLD